MCTADDRFTVTHFADYKNIKTELNRRWKALENIPNIFRYKLNVRQQKILDGRFGYLIEWNTERTTLRRPPQSITSLLPEYDGTKFNFNRVDATEILFECVDQIERPRPQQLIISFLINNSPLTPFHSLLCPNLAENRPQVLTKEAILGACHILIGFADRNYHIGFNSPGAYASVNHLHMHLLYIETPLPIQNYTTHHLIKNVHTVDNSYPAHAYCFCIPSNGDDATRIVDDVYRLIEYFWLKIVPHNLLWTFGSIEGCEYLKIFIFPRMEMSEKPTGTWNMAFCELSGYITVGAKAEYDALTEDKIAREIANVVGDAKCLDDDVINLFSSH